MEGDGDVEGSRRIEFDPGRCNAAKGNWVFNSSLEPVYTDETCPYLDLQVSCGKNGRPDTEYLNWEWQPDECDLPRLYSMSFDSPFFLI